MARTQINSSLIITTGATAIVPSGVIFDYAGTSAPSGWLECDGSVVSQTTYANLFTAIGSSWNTGGEGGGNFRLPDFRRRASVGRGGSGTGTLGNTVGNTGGEETHALITGELAAHNHTVNITDPGHNHTQNSHGHGISVNFNGAGGAAETVRSQVSTSTTGTLQVAGTTATNISNTTGVTASSVNTGSGTGHNTIQPSAVVTKIIKI